MDVLVLIGRIMFVGLFVNSGIGHLRFTDMMAGYAQAKGVPNARQGVQASGVLMLVGALMVLLGIWADLGALLLAVFLVPTAVLMHGFWKESDPAARATEMVQFLKDIALAGAALMLLGLFSELGDDLGLMITGPLF